MAQYLDKAACRKTLTALMPRLKREFGVSSLGLFGSYVRDEQTPESDIDLLVTFGSAPSLIRFLALEQLLSETLGAKVDLVMRSALKPHIGEAILAELEQIA